MKVKFRTSKNRHLLARDIFLFSSGFLRLRRSIFVFVYRVNFLPATFYVGLRQPAASDTTRCRGETKRVFCSLSPFRAVPRRARVTSGRGESPQGQGARPPRPMVPTRLLPSCPSRRQLGRAAPCRRGGNISFTGVGTAPVPGGAAVKRQRPPRLRPSDGR